MALFQKKSTATEGEAADNGAANQFEHDLRKAGKFYDHARSTADARNYDYSIECYINGLKFDPDNQNIHEELREVALKRKVSNGKPAKAKPIGKDAISKFLTAEKTLANDPFNPKLIVETVERMVEVHQQYDNLAMGDTAAWLGRFALELIMGQKKPDAGLVMRLIDALEAVEAYETACQGCRLAIRLKPDDIELPIRLRDLETQEAMIKGRYDEKATDATVDEAEKQRLIDESEGISGTDAAKMRIVNARREAFELDTNDLDARMKLVEALRNLETPEAEGEAIDLLTEAYESTKNYRYKMFIGDIKIKQKERPLRKTRGEVRENPTDAELRQKFDQLSRELLALELNEYAERVQNYPTDMALRFKYGRCLFLAQKFDEAIGELQQAKADPKARALASILLGRAYINMSWFDEAIETLDEGIKHHQITDDPTGKELSYYLMDALERKAREEKSLGHAERAREIASRILQTDIKYRDIKDRMNNIRALQTELRG